MDCSVAGAMTTIALSVCGTIAGIGFLGFLILLVRSV